MTSLVSHTGSHVPFGSIRYRTERRAGGGLELVLDPGLDPDPAAGAGSVTATLVVSPLAGAASSPRDTAAAKTTPVRSTDAARNSVIPESSSTNGLSSAAKRYSRPGDSVPASILPVPSSTRDTTCAAAGL